MAKDDRPQDGAAGRRRKGPVITLEATDVTPADALPAEALPETASAEAPPPTQSAEIAAASAPEAAAGETAQAAIGEAAEGPAAKVSEEAAAPPAAAAEAPVSEPPAEGPAPAGNGEPAAPPAAARPAQEAAFQPPPGGRPAHPVEPPVASPPAPGFGRLVAAGLIGALLTLAIGYVAQVGGLALRGPDSQAAAEAERRLADVERLARDAAARPVPAPPDLAPLAARLDALDQARGALETRIAALEQRPAPEAAPEPVDLAPLNREIEALKAAIAAVAERPEREPPPQPAPGPDIAAIEARLETLASAQADRLGTVEGRVQQLGALAGRIEVLSGDLRAAAEAAQESQAKAAALEPRVAALDAARAAAQQTAQRAGLLAGLVLLRGALDRGAPFAAELSAAKTLGADAEAVAPLEPLAERGVPTRAALARRFAAIAPDLARVAAPRPEGGLMDRLAANAQALVRVRPAGEPAGDTVPAVVARIEAKLGRGDLAGALDDYQRLPPQAQELAREIAGQARARLDAEAALNRLATAALAAPPSR